MLRYVMGFKYDGRVLLRQNEAGSWDGIQGVVRPGETDKRAMVRVFKEATGIDAPAAGWLQIAQMSDDDTILTIYVSHGGLDGVQSGRVGGGGALRAQGYVPLDVSPTAAWVAGMLLDHTLAYITVNFDRSDD